ncbi:MAG: hypothetical protein QXL94_04505, partial [Candidatus Parvarchaeum sp.]
MHDYYYFGITCPNCHEPYLNEIPIVKQENLFTCSSCNTHFYSTFDLRKGNNGALIYRFNDMPEELKVEVLPEMPLFWKIDLNIIEKAYLDWIKTKPKGNFLVSWPWNKPKFTTIMLFECLISGLIKKAVIIDNFASSENRETFGYPNIDYVFSRTLCLETENSKEPEEQINKNVKWFTRRLQKLVLEKERSTNCEIRNINTGKVYAEKIDSNIDKHLLNEIEDNIIEEHGNEAIRKIEKHKLGKSSKSVIKNENGFIDITLREIEERNSRLNYDKSWLRNVLFNLNNAIYYNQNFQVGIAKTYEELYGIGTGVNLAFVSSDIDADDLFLFLKKFGAEIIIFNNCDYFIMDKYFIGKRVKNLYNFLKENTDSTIIMFSTNPEVRSLYGINDSQETNGITKYNVLPHTWDFKTIMNYIKSKYYLESKYSNPLSSRFEELEHEGEKDISIDYEEVPSLEPVDNFVKHASIIRNKNIRDKILSYVKGLEQSALSLMGDYSKATVYKGNIRLTGVQFTYAMFLNLLREEIGDSTELKNLISLINSVYKTNTDIHVNPLRDAISRKINEILKINGVSVTIVVKKYEVKGTRLLLENEPIAEYIGSRVFVCSWDQILAKDTQYDFFERNYLIATGYPPFEYNLRLSKFSETIFIGSPETIKKIKLIVDNRITEVKTHPLYLLPKTAAAPALLIDSQSNISMLSEDLLEELISEVDEVNIEIGSSIDGNNAKTLHNQLNNKVTRIRAGDKAILTVDKKGYGMFIPLGAEVLTFEKSRGFNEMILSKESLISAGGTITLLVDTREFYISYKSIFVEYMLEYSQSIKFTYSLYSWNGFLQLMNDATSWIKMLEMQARNYAKSNNISMDEASDRLASYLSSLGLNAKDPNYIRRWWSDYNSIIVMDKVYRVYQIDRPKSINDLKLIYEGMGKAPWNADFGEEDWRHVYFSALYMQK